MNQPTPEPEVIEWSYDGKFTISYELSDGTGSAFRVSRGMGKKIAEALRIESAGLNPTAYREVVEALRLIVKDWESDDQAQQGLAGIVGAPPWIAKAKDALHHAEGKER